MSLTTFTTVGTTAWEAPITTTITVWVWGAGGGSGGSDDAVGVGGVGGGGGWIKGTFSVTAGEDFTIHVGAGGGGGPRFTPSGGTGGGGGGGGLTKIVRDSDGKLMITAGSGGGGGGGDNSATGVGAGGAGGGSTGGAGGNASAGSTGGGGGTQTTGGAAGTGANAGTVGTSGVGGRGGNAGAGPSDGNGGAANGGSVGGGPGGSVITDNFGGGGGGGTGQLDGGPKGGGGGGCSASGQAGGSGGGGGPNSADALVTVSNNVQASGRIGAGQGEAEYPANTGNGALAPALGVVGIAGQRGAVVIQDGVVGPAITSVTGNNAPKYLIGGNTGHAIVGTDFTPDGGGAKIELGNASTYAACTLLVQQTETGTRTATTATFTAVRGGLPLGTPVWLYVTNNTPITNATGFALGDIWDVAPKRKVWYRWLHGEVGGGTGNVSYTSDDVPGTPKAAFIIASYVSDGNAAVSFSISVGITTGVGVERCVGTSCSDGDASNDRYRSTTAVVSLRTPATGAAVAIANINAFLSNGIQLNWTTANGVAWRIEILLMGGDDMTVALNTVAVNASPVTGLSFLPDFVFEMSHCATGTADSAFGLISPVGFFTRQLTQCNLWMGFGSAATGLTNADSVAVIDGFAAQHENLAYTWQAVIASVVQGGFSWTGSNSDTFDYLAVDVKGAGVEIGVITKTTTATPPDVLQSHPLPWRPQAAMFLNSRDTDHVHTTPDGGSRSVISGWDAVTGNVFSAAQSAIITGLNVDQRLTRLKLVIVNDDTTNESAADVAQGGASFELNWTTSGSIAYKIVYIAFEEGLVVGDIDPKNVQVC